MLAREVEVVVHEERRVVLVVTLLLSTADEVGRVLEVYDSTIKIIIIRTQ